MSKLQIALKSVLGIIVLVALIMIVIDDSIPSSYFRAGIILFVTVSSLAVYTSCCVDYGNFGQTGPSSISTIDTDRPVDLSSR